MDKTTKIARRKKRAAMALELAHLRSGEFSASLELERTRADLARFNRALAATRPWSRERKRIRASIKDATRAWHAAVARLKGCKALVSDRLAKRRALLAKWAIEDEDSVEI